MLRAAAALIVPLFIAASPVAFADASAVEYGPPTAPRRSAGWDVMGGGVPRGDLAQVTFGFSRLQLSYARAMSKRLSVGGSVAFDYAHWAPSDSFGSALTIGAPVRFAAHRGDKLSVGLFAEPALYLGFTQPRFSQFIAGLGLNLGANAGWRLRDWLQVGGGIDVPLLFGLPTDGRDAFVAMPVLIGPTAELYFAKAWALTGEAKLGPHIVSDDFFGTRVGLRVMVGIARRIP